MGLAQFNMFTEIKSIILDILFPPVCLGCQKYLEKKDDFICDDCYCSIKLNNTLFCPVCQARLAENKKICNHGSEKSNEFPYLLAAASNYDDQIIRNLVHCYKYKNFNGISAVLGDILNDYVQTANLPVNDFSVSYIPLHFIRENNRGFNQSKLLAEIISKNFNLELVDVLVKTKNNPPQAKSKNREERKNNISGAFQAINPEKINDKNIVLIDDVYTSGATMSEAAHVLKQNGANKIIALVVAKA